MIHLPQRNYLEELKEENLIEDIKYFEIIDCVLEGKKYLPKWYLNVSFRHGKSDFDVIY